MTDNEIIVGLALFLRGESLEECPIKILNRIDLDEHEAQLVWFTFGINEDGTCPAIVWSDGTIFTPTDWQYNWVSYFEEEEKPIESTEWMDCRFVHALTLFGLPRLLF